MSHLMAFFADVEALFEFHEYTVLFSVLGFWTSSCSVLSSVVLFIF